VVIFWGNDDDAVHRAMIHANRKSDCLMRLIGGLEQVCLDFLSSEDGYQTLPLADLWSGLAGRDWGRWRNSHGNLRSWLLAAERLGVPVVHVGCAFVRFVNGLERGGLVTVDRNSGVERARARNRRGDS
jgi:hypothetical protein